MMLTGNKINVLGEVMTRECSFIRQNDYDYILYECSNCNEIWCFEEATPRDNQYNYCPKCGAKIKEVIELEDEED